MTLKILLICVGIVLFIIMLAIAFIKWDNEEDSGAKNSSNDIDDIFRDYQKLASKFVNKSTLEDDRIINHAKSSLCSGRTIQETIMQTYLFDTALQVQSAGKSITKLTKIFYSIQKPLLIFKEWKDSGKIREDFWRQHSSSIFGVTNVNQEQHRILKSVLDFIENGMGRFHAAEQTAESMSAHKLVINFALTSLHTKQISEDLNNDEFAYRAAAEITRSVMIGAGTDLSHLVEEDILIGGVFAYAISSDIADAFNLEFEIVSTMSVIALFGSGKADVIYNIGYTYNQSLTDDKIIVAIRQNVILWLTDPTKENFDKLIKLYGLCRQNLSG